MVVIGLNFTTVLKLLSQCTRTAFNLILCLVVAWMMTALLAVAAGDLLPPSVIDKLNELLAPYVDLSPGYKLRDGEEFEYVVVGAGAGGCAVAARLAQAGYDVLLVEAGGKQNLASTVPGAAMSLLGSDLDWQYPTLTNKKSCLSSLGQQCRFSRGKCLGGSTSINYMMYVRGNRQDYELDLPGWSWRELEPYFLRYEGLQDLARLPRSSVPYHNTSGYMQIGLFTDSGNPWHGRLIAGFEALGFPRNYDVNAQSQIGVSQVIGYVYKGERMSANRGYLKQETVRQLLKVAENALCTGVNIDEGNVARGVTVVQNGQKLRVFAKREVILCAGAIGTPQILMLSGVGPAQHLRSLGIPVKADLPVGEDMSDHVLSFMVILVDRPLLAVTQLALQAAEYAATRGGPLASDGVTDVTVLVNTHCFDAQKRQLSANCTDYELPNMQLHCGFIEKNLLSLAPGVIQKATGFTSDIGDQLLAANKNRGLIVTSPAFLRPKSRGWVRLASVDPLANPVIFPNYLGEEADVEEVLRCITIMEHLVETPPFKKLGASLLRFKLPRCPTYEADREGYWRCYARELTFSTYHAAGTTALGRVLDERMRVRGVRSLRVADLGAWPYVPRGNTASLSIALGERAAALVQEDDV